MHRKEALKKMEAEILRKFGEGKLMKASDLEPVKEKILPTGFPELDEALGLGGIPRGKITEIFGSDASGKTSLALSITKQVQKRGGNILYIDADCALSPYQLQNMGVSTKGLYIAHPETMEDAYEICSRAVQAFSLIVIDSITALQTRADQQAQMGDHYAGKPQAVWTDQFLRVITKWTKKNDCTIILVNQVRDNPTVFFGNPEKTTCGRALKYYAAVRIEAKRGGLSWREQIFIFKVAKSKYSTPLKYARYTVKQQTTAV